MNTPDNDENEYKSLNWIIRAATTLVFFAALGSCFLLVLETNFFKPTGGYDLGKIGSWGDAVGGILNPILSFLALIGLLWTIRLQSKELSYTRKEIENSTAELKGSREANEKLVQAAEQQNIENSFFQLFNFLTRTVESMQFSSHFGPTSTKTWIGTKGFEKVSKNIIRALSNICSDMPDRDLYRGNPDDLPIRGWENIRKEFENDTDAMKSLMLENYRYQYIQHQAELGRYFRVLYNILRFLSEKKELLPVSMAQTYIKLVRASLSNYELFLIFLNCLTTTGDSMKKYADEFSLFDNLPPELFQFTYDNEYGNTIGTLDFSKLHSEFNEIAFGDNFILFQKGA